MSNKVEYIDIKNRKCYFFDYIINIKNFDSNNIKIDEKSHQNIFIYFIRYVTTEDSKYIKIDSVNPSYLILKKVNECF